MLPLIIIVGMFFLLLAPNTPLANDKRNCKKQKDALKLAKCYCNEIIENNKKVTRINFPTEKWLQRAEKYQRAGDYQKSTQTLCFALQNSSVPKKSYARHKILGSLGHAFFMEGDTETAVILLRESGNRAEKLGHLHDAAVAYNNLGNVCATYRDADEQICATYYSLSAKLATQAGNDILTIKALINWVQTAIEQSQQDSLKDFHTIKPTLFDLLKQTNALAPSPHKIQALLRLGQLTFLTSRSFSSANKKQLRRQAYEVLKKAWRLAQKLDDSQGVSQALGNIGQLYKYEKNYEEALKATRHAIFSAQEVNALELLYYWQWKNGEILKEQGKKVAAMLAYKQAIDTLWSIRYDLSKIYRAFRSSFRDKVGALFLEFTELLLEPGSALSQEQRKEICGIQKTGYMDICLKKALDTLEKLKAAELFDYFQNECVIRDQIELTEALEKLEQKNTAILYPIIFKDRLELILINNQKTVRRTVYDTNSEKLDYEVGELKIWHGGPHNNKFIPHAQKLYDWLIRPLEEKNDLNGIDTLVFVPDGSLRRIPMAALHSGKDYLINGKDYPIDGKDDPIDGKDYLINKYAIAVVPGLTLRATAPEAGQDNKRILLAGLDLKKSKFVEGTELDRLNSTKEIENINTAIQGAYDEHEELLNDKFTENHLKDKLTKEPYFIVHISSHAVFKADIKNTYILITEGSEERRLFLEEFEDLLLLNRTHESSLNLITLSACQTALGDDRAALGLSGVALRAGAQSAVASLWKTTPNFTTKFMPVFYRKISEGMPKAKALQKAQQEMITNSYLNADKARVKYDHPYFWASFILIGNWR